MNAADMIKVPGGVRFAGRFWPCSHGKGGVRRDKREGDGATPVGDLRIVGCLYRPDRMARPAPWALPIGPSDLWSDASGTVEYNQMVRAPYAHSHEKLYRGDRLYDLVLLTDWNWPKAEAGRGSAIFLHRWRRPGFGTEGCLAFDPADLWRIAAMAAPGTRLIIPKARES